MTTAEIIIFITELILAALAAVNIIISRKRSHGDEKSVRRELAEAKTQLRLVSEKLSELRQEQSGQHSELRRELAASVNTGMRSIMESNREQLDAMSKSISAQLSQTEVRLRTLETTNEQKLSDIRASVSRQLSQISEENSKSLSKLTEDNNRQLDKIRGTVDEKLQSALDKKITESFRTVSERLEQVYKGLGEMQNIAKGVGDLKSVLSNVKTRGILGEIQLGSILGQILAPGQYEENIATVPKSKERVEFAVKLPGADDGSFVYLPIDSKFNADVYTHLQSAYESGDREAVAAAKKALFAALKKNAKDISEKYIYPPATTQFAIMFLPFEGLYAEAVNSDMVSVLQKEYNVNIAGPSTMAAMLNSLQMGFRTLAIQKRSGEVWKILGAVKTEFSKFEDALSKTQKRMQALEKDLDDLVGKRTRQINRSLRSVEMLEDGTASELLEE